MRTYAIAHVQSVTPSQAIVEYLQQIDKTLAPYGGRFLVHDPSMIINHAELSHLTSAYRT